ncbi:MAG: Double zinc ribbon [Symbiobacteriaceae bacterium]|nr:Double zinc ribbon [Symbiobacteriaceae bacterium]
MRWNLKRLTATVAMFYGLVTLVTAGWAYYLEQNWYLGQWQSAAAVQAEVSRAIRESGVKSDELQRLLSQMNIIMDWSGSYVTEADHTDGQILAATTQRLMNQTWSEVDQVYRMSDYYWRGNLPQTFVGPDGKQYALWALLDRRAIAWPVLNQIALVTAVAAWLAIATCLALDVRDRTSRSARAWFLLGLLTGPVGAAIWLAARSGAGQVSSASSCPGCGSTPPDGAAFCHRCGFALKPICPECKHPVALDWDYCTRCGAPLIDQPVVALKGRTAP